MASQKFQLADLSLGLATKARASRIPPGACQDGSANFWLYRDVLASAPGYTRVTNALVDDHTILLDRGDYFRGPIAATTSRASLKQGGNRPWTFEAVFRLDSYGVDAWAGGGMPLSMIACKSSGEVYGGDAATIITSAGTNYALFVIGGSVPVVAFYCYDSTGTQQTVGGTTAIQLGVFYHVAIVATATGDLKCYLGLAGSALTLEATSVGAIPAGGLMDSVMDLFLGSMPITPDITPPTTASVRESALTQFPLLGIVQEVRYWNSDRSASINTYKRQLTAAEVGSEANLVAYYQLTGLGSNRYFFQSSVGTAGSGTGQSPILALSRRDATWLKSSHVLGNPLSSETYSTHLDGENQGLTILDSYLYRDPSLNESGTYAGLLNARTRLAFTVKFRPDALVDGATIWHWTHVPDDDFHATVAHARITNTTANGIVNAPANEEWSMAMEIRLQGGNYRVRGCLAYIRTSAAPTTYANAFASVAVNLVAGTEYTATVAVDFSGGGSLHTQVNSTSQTTNLTNLDSNSTMLRCSPDDPVSSKRAAWMTLGRAILRTRKLNNAPGDPNDVDVEYDFARSFPGVLQKATISTSDTLTGASFASLAQVVVRDRLINRNNVGAQGLNVLSHWLMNEGNGTFIEDIGGVGNSITFVEDPKHRWGRSGLTTQTKDPVLGLFEHRYRTATGEMKKVCAVAGGSIYEVNQGAGSLAFLADGLRNEDGNLVSTAKHQDSTILCMGGVQQNAQLWKDQLYRLSIDPPTGPIAWGLSDQNDPNAVLDAGTRKWTFTFFSSHQNKRSSPGPVVTSEIWAKKANMAFGRGAEINQTRPATIDSVVPETFDFTRTATPQIRGFSFIAYVGSSGAKAATDPAWWRSAPGSGGTSEAKLKRLKLTDNIFIKGGSGASTAASTSGHAEDEATVQQTSDAVSNKSQKARIEERPSGSMRMVGAFAGATGFLSISDLSGEALTTRAGGAIDWNLRAGSNVIGVGEWSGAFTARTDIGTPGTGVTGHGIGLPVSTDPQVTHLEIWRTVAGGSQFRLVARLRNGELSFVDNVADENLVGEVLDLNQGQVPAVKYVTDFGGRAIYFGDALSPQRLYISEVGQPWNVPPQNTIDFLDGTTLALTGAARTENALTLFKNDTTFVLSNTGNPQFPFQVETRMRDIGCVAPRGIVNVNEVFYYPDEQGFYGYDTSVPRGISSVIDDTWNAVSAADYAKVVGAHDRKNNCILWFVPSGDTKEADGTTVCNDQALVWWYEKGQGQDGGIYGWSLLTGLHVKFATTIQDSNEVNRVWLVDPLGYIYLWDSGTNYGVGSLTSRTPALAAGTFSTTQVTVAQATLANVPDGYKGFPVTVVKASTGERATRLCIADTLASPSVLTLDHVLPFTPANTSDFSVIIGSIETKWISGEMSPAGQDGITKLLKTHMQLTPQATAARFNLKWLCLYGQDPTLNVEQTFVESVNGTNTTGISNQRNDYLAATPGRGLRVRYTFESLGADQPFEVRSLSPEMDTDAGRGSFRTDN